MRGVQRPCEAKANKGKFPPKKPQRSWLRTNPTSSIGLVAVGPVLENFIKQPASSPIPSNKHTGALTSTRTRKCPYCGKFKTGLEDHIRVKHSSGIQVAKSKTQYGVPPVKPLRCEENIAPKPAGTIPPALPTTDKINRAALNNVIAPISLGTTTPVSNLLECTSCQSERQAFRQTNELYRTLSRAYNTTSVDKVDFLRLLQVLNRSIAGLSPSIRSHQRKSVLKIEAFLTEMKRFGFLLAPSTKM